MDSPGAFFAYSTKLNIISVYYIVFAKIIYNIRIKH